MSSSQHRKVISIPQEKIAGHIIGKGGSQINRLKQVTQCNIFIKDNKRVEISGRNMSSVERAGELIQLIINNALQVYEHPNMVCNVLLMDEDGRIQLEEYKPHVYGEKAQSTTEKVFRIALVEPEETEEPELKVLEKLTSRLSLSQQELPTTTTQELVSKIEKGSCCFTHSQQVETELVKHGVERVSSNFKELMEKKNNELKSKMLIKISLGKKTFYTADRNDNSVNVKRVYNFSEFSNLKVGFEKDIKSTWKTEIDEKFIEKLRIFIKENDWKLDSQIEGVSCHCVELVDGILGRENTKGGKRLNFKIVREDTTMDQCKLVKIRSQMNKLMFLDICNIEPSHKKSELLPDVRIRFQTEQHEQSLDQYSELKKYISYLRFNDEHLSEDQVPSTLREKFRKDTFRYKKKEIYILKNCKITINSVRAEDRKWFEVQMSPLKPFDPTKNNGEEIEKEVLSMIENMRYVLNSV